MVVAIAPCATPFRHQILPGFKFSVPKPSAERVGSCTIRALRLLKKLNRISIFGPKCGKIRYYPIFFIRVLAKKSV